MYLLKLAHRYNFSCHIIFSEMSGSRKLKVLLSVGGWTYSQDGHFAFVTNPTLRATFISSAIRLIKDYGFDGMCVAPFCSRIYYGLTSVYRPHRSDIDFEYPSGTAQGRSFANLLTELRSALDALARSNGDTVPYQLTVSSFYTTNSLLEQGFLPSKGRRPRWLREVCQPACRSDGFGSELLEFDGMKKFELSRSRGD